MTKPKTDNVKDKVPGWIQIGSAFQFALQSIEDKRSRLSEEFGQGPLVLDRVA